jgi:Gas vesicle synthesis protein GvpL/GvpF
LIELYAITDDPKPPDPPLRAVASEGLAVLYAPAERREVTSDALWRHEEVVEALMAERNLLPVRFGTLVRDPDAAAQALSERSAELASSLDRVRGAVELAVRVETRDPEPDPARRDTSGREYMSAKARRKAKANLVHEPLTLLSRESTVQNGPELVRAAYLVDRVAVESFVELVRRLQETHRELDVLCTGPWPPYSFAGETP